MTEKLASFIVETEYEHVPREAVRIAKKAALDCLSVALAGCTEPAVEILARQTARMGTVSEAGVFCQGFKAAVELAAWVNGTMCHTLDYDDTFPSSVGYNCHPTAAVLPAVLAIGQKCGILGKDILLAYIIGVEVESRIGLTCGLLQSELGWHPTAIIGSMGSAASVAKLMGLNKIETQIALGIAGSLAGGLQKNFGTMTKALHAGNAARNGVVACLLAQNGFTANSNILDGTSGFCSVFSGGARRRLLDKTWDLGNNWHTISPGISIKPYPSCRATHSSIDAILYLKKKYNIRADQVAEITCKTSKMVPKLAMYNQPTNGYEGKFSLEYCVAIALLDGEVSLKQFTDSKVLSTAAQQLLRKIKLVHPDNWPIGVDLMQELMVKLKDGTEYSHSVEIPKGDPENPMSDKELLTKFRDCASLFLMPSESGRLIELIYELESLNDISELMDIMTNAGKIQGSVK